LQVTERLAPPLRLTTVRLSLVGFYPAGWGWHHNIDYLRENAHADATSDT